MLEGVLQLGKQARLVEEPGGLQVGEASSQLVLPLRGDCLQEREGHVLADDRGRFQQRFHGGREAIDAGSQNCLYARGDLDRLHGAGETICAARAGEGMRFDQHAHALFEKERIALGAFDQESAERGEARVVTEQRAEQLLGTLGWQWVDAELTVVGLAAPPMLVLGPVVGQK